MEYNVSEEAASMDFTFRVLQGVLGFDVNVLFFTYQGSATGMRLQQILNKVE